MRSYLVGNGLQSIWLLFGIVVTFVIWLIIAFSLSTIGSLSSKSSTIKERYCPNCGVKGDRSRDIYCDNCGEKFGSNE
jgi:hypothetical protein